MTIFFNYINYILIFVGNVFFLCFLKKNILKKINIVAIQNLELSNKKSLFDLFKKAFFIYKVDC